MAIGVLFSLVSWGPESHSLEVLPWGDTLPLTFLATSNL